MVPVESRNSSQKFHLTRWFFQFINGITFKWDYIIGRSVDLLVCIGLWTKLRTYRVPLDPVIWSCRSFGFIWQAFMLNWMLWTKNYLKIFHSKQDNAPPKMELVTSLMNFNVNHVGYLKVYNIIKNMKSLVLLYLQLL